MRHKYFGETEEESKVKPIKDGEPRAYYLINGEPLDLHRPFIDEVWFKQDGKDYRRVEQTLDVWMDSGSMPFAQFHYPFVNKGKFEDSFPGDFISEYTGQIRAWFYVLHVISNAIFEKPAFKNVLVTGVLAGNDGRKMSKSFGNYPDPQKTLEEYGGDALRLYLMSTPLMNGNDASFSEEDLRLKVREFLIPVWNVYKYFVTYANLIDWTPDPEILSADFDQMVEAANSELDKWILVVTNEAVRQTDESLSKYDIPTAIRTLQDLIGEVSKWFIRRSRDRFAAGEENPVKTLYYVLHKFTLAAAPIIPFTTEEIYQGLFSKVDKEAKESVHLNIYPTSSEQLDSYKQLLIDMKVVRSISELGQSIRTTEGIKLRQPLSKIEVSSASEISDWMAGIIQDELNIKEVVQTEKITKSKGVITYSDNKNDLEVGLFTELSPELIQEGLMRELTRNIQASRKNNGFEVTDQIKITYSTDDDDVKSVFINFESDIMDSVNAKAILVGEAKTEQIINDKKVNIDLAKA